MSLLGYLNPFRVKPSKSNEQPIVPTGPLEDEWVVVSEPNEQKAEDVQFSPTLRLEEMEKNNSKEADATPEADNSSARQIEETKAPVVETPAIQELEVVNTAPVFHQLVANIASSEIDAIVNKMVDECCNLSADMVLPAAYSEEFGMTMNAEDNFVPFVEVAAPLPVVHANIDDYVVSSEVSSRPPSKRAIKKQKDRVLKISNYSKPPKPQKLQRIKPATYARQSKMYSKKNPVY